MMSTAYWLKLLYFMSFVLDTVRYFDKIASCQKTSLLLFSILNIGLCGCYCKVDTVNSLLEG